MVKVRSWAGLDVHARSVLAVTLDAESGELRSCRLPGETARVVEFCVALPGPTRVAYEAGPTGYGLARALHAAGVGCVVASPGKIERPAQDKVKTDQRDAERVLRLCPGSIAIVSHRWRDCPLSRVPHPPAPVRARRHVGPSGPACPGTAEEFALRATAQPRRYGDAGFGTALGRGGRRSREDRGAMCQTEPPRVGAQRVPARPVGS
jgi:hypothetical protein